MGDTLFTQRYSGCMVADIHSVLIKSGIFMYPSSFVHPLGKLRLVYECNPFAFVMQIAGGMSINGNDQILDLIPQSLHARSPLFIGSIQLIKKLIRDKSLAISI